MAEARPELVFLSGSQQGTRTVLMDDVVILGRAASAGVRISEEYVSRKQLRFELSPAGWVVENLSASGARVNGKKYKPGKKIILETGDVIAVGLETEMLFVAPGDDPREALEACRRTHPLRPPQPQPKQTPAPPPAKPRPAEHIKPESPKTASPPTAPPPDRARKVRMRKYAIGFGVYLAVLVGVVVLIILLRGKGQTPGRSVLPPLTDRRIAEAITAPLERPQNPTLAAGALNEALTLYRDRDVSSGNLYRCVKSFKLHLAHGRGSEFASANHARMLREVTDELIGLVSEKYRSAWTFEQAQRWDRARQIYYELLQILPERRDGNPVYEKIVKNIIAHQEYVSDRLSRRSRTSKRW